MKLRNILTFSITLLALTACNNGPKVIPVQTENENAVNSSGIFGEVSDTTQNTNANFNSDKELHSVIINEVLPATKYVYLNVTENAESFWIATSKKDVLVGETYFYTGGLLKTNFESKEYNRVFEKIYLITNLVPKNHGNNSGSLNMNTIEPLKSIASKVDIPTHTEKIIEQKGSILIADLVKDPKKYEGKTIQISGKCVKINPNIMNRNWIHIQDGSMDDFDLVITSDTFVPEGTIITIKATVGLNRDFGAGYTYDLILENGTLLN